MTQHIVCVEVAIHQAEVCPVESRTRIDVELPAGKNALLANLTFLGAFERDNVQLVRGRGFVVIEGALAVNATLAPICSSASSERQIRPGPRLVRIRRAD